jgi:hypothetical protein
MCDPVSLGLAAISTATSIYGQVEQHNAAKNQKKQVDASADQSTRQAISQLSLRGSQEQDAAGMSIYDADRQTRVAAGQARVSAGEAGVAGASVDAIMSDINNQDSKFKTETNINLANQMDQINMDKMGARVQGANQKASVPNPSNGALGVGIAGSLMDFSSILINRNTKAAEK